MYDGGSILWRGRLTAGTWMEAAANFWSYLLGEARAEDTASLE